MSLPWLFLLNVVFAQVDTVWTRRYNGPDHFQDYAHDVMVDNSGNIYVTGASFFGNPISQSNVVTIKYNATGNSLWLNCYDGVVHDDDQPIGLARDHDDNLYICGYTTGLDMTHDYLVIKYTADGDTLLVRSLNGPWGDHDEVVDFVVDDSNNIYVTGITNTGWTYMDYMTVKYDVNGDTIWRRFYDHTAQREDIAKAIDIDKDGNVFVVGQSWDYYTRDDYALVKYDIGGSEAWITRYNGTADSTDIPQSLVIDDSNYIYVTGASWTAGYGYDIVTIKYNSDGDTVWTRHYNGIGSGDDYPCTIQIDDSGDILVTGYSRESTTDYCTIKYHSDGSQAWVVNYNGTGNGTDKARAMAIDDSNNVYVVGESQGSGTNYDYATVKYSPNGSEIWSIRYEGYSIDRPNAIVVDSAGFVYVTGESSGGAGAYYDYLTIKYCQGTGIFENQEKVKTLNLLAKNSVFRDHLEINFSVQNRSNMMLKIYDVNGSLVTDLSTDVASTKILDWNGRDDRGNIIPSGIYFIHLVTDIEHVSQKIIKVN